MFTQADLALLADKGITEMQIAQQLRYFEDGFPFLPIKRAASLGDGIWRLSPEEQMRNVMFWDLFLKEGEGHAVKFVPASGAASRMFKDLYTFLESDEETPNNAFVQKFFDGINHFAFYQALDKICEAKTGKNIAQLLSENKHKTIVHYLLTKEGLNYGELPKGLLLFHSYPEELRTPFLEHLVEGALYANNSHNKVYLHFTVSPEHRKLFEQHWIDYAEIYQQYFGICFMVSFSEQKSSTDTVAVDMNNVLFRQADGSLLFRPAGHGALIENLNDLDADIVFIKNIDNIVPDRLKESTIEYKRLLAGVLVAIQRQTFDYLQELENNTISDAKLQIIKQFCEIRLNNIHPQINTLSHDELVAYLYKKLNRPIRVCGMVLNEGEPGGGPYWVENPDGTISLHILESSQIDTSYPQSKVLMEQSSYFNPVDLVCSLTDYKGDRFNLLDFVDKQAGFISTKSTGGKILKALELPGLWNGAMSDWNTIFVEVPIETFNPVKTVNDLLREQHQSVI